MAWTTNRSLGSSETKKDSTEKDSTTDKEKVSCVATHNFPFRDECYSYAFLLQAEKLKKFLNQGIPEGNLASAAASALAAAAVKAKYLSQVGVFWLRYLNPLLACDVLALPYWYRFSNER